MSAPQMKAGAWDNSNLFQGVCALDARSGTRCFPYNSSRGLNIQTSVFSPVGANDIRDLAMSAPVLRQKRKMLMRTLPVRFPMFVLSCALLTGAITSTLHSEPIRVRYPQGSAHGWLALKTVEGIIIATGDATQIIHGDRVTSRVTFHFRDGSLDDDTTVFSQRRVFRLISDHHIQRGPSFPKPIDVLIDAVTGKIISHNQDGTIREDHFDLPSDVSNGLPPNLLLNILPSTPETRLSFVAPTAKPRLISMSIKPAGEVPFSVGGTSRMAIDYVLHVELGGLAGVIAPIIGKQPADYHIWILEGASPGFIREEGQLYEGGPIWRIEQISPTFSR